MKKQTIPNQPEELPVKPQRPEIKQPEDPQTHMPDREITEPPADLPPPPDQKEVKGFGRNRW